MMKQCIVAKGWLPNDTVALNILTVCLKSSNLSLFFDQIFSLTQEWEIEGLS